MQIQATAQARPAWSGIFTIPSISAEVPRVISKAGKRGRVLAQFAEASKAAGVPLPAGHFASIEEVVGAQWQQLIDKAYPNDTSVLGGAVEVVITDEKLVIWSRPSTNLNVFQAKPVVERLEALMPGLGWYAYKAVTWAHRDGLGLYDLEVVMHYGLPFSLDDLGEFTDESYAEYILLNHENRRVDAITPEVIAELRGEYAFWPSDILAELDGHGHLLHAPGCDQPELATDRAVSSWLRKNVSHPDWAMVQSLRDLHAQWKTKSNRPGFCLRPTEEDDDYHDYIGATGFIAWNDPGMLLETAGHFEQNAMAGEYAGEAVGVNFLNFDGDHISDKDLRDFARDFVDYLKKRHLLAKCLSYFPIWEGSET